MVPSARVVLLGDQTVEPRSVIRTLTKQSQQSAALRLFLRKSENALRYELSRSSSIARNAFPSFSSLIDLAESAAGSGIPNSAVSTVLLCISQLGLLVAEEQANPAFFDTSRYSATHFVGLCTGMLPAAAAAATYSAEQLLKLTPELVCLSLRLGVEVMYRSSLIERSSESWAVIVTGIPPSDQQAMLDSFHKEKDLPSTKVAYISAESENTSTVSGPPSTLESYFASSERIQNARKIKLPISAAFHAQHLSKPNLEKIVGTSATWDEYSLRPGVELVSTSTGKPVSGATTLRDLLTHVVLDALQEPLRWSSVVRQLISSADSQSIEVYTIGHVRAADDLRREMKKANVTATDPQRKAQSNTRPANSSNDIAIVGISGRLPGGETLEEIWEFLEKGKDLHKEIPEDRFPIDTHVDPTGQGRNTTYTKYGCFIDRPGFFDARLFNMSPREAAQTDPAQRLLLLTTYEALEMAGYSLGGSPSYVGDRIGTFFGQTLDDYRESNACQNVDMYYVTGGIRAFGPGRLNYYFKWDGPSYCLDAACSSSALSIQLGIQSLLTGECDTAVAGGTNVLTGSDMFSGLSKGSFLSPTGPCKTFDDNADGYCRGDGVGTVILKRLEDAIAEGDNIQAVIKSATTNHSAYAHSITHPHSGAQQNLIKAALRQADVEPHEIDYVEMHGTGTQAGDATEFDSVTGVLSHGRTSQNPLHIGAIKANIGHAEAAAGINSLIKVVMMMRKNKIPPHVGIKTVINSKFPPLDSVKVCIDRELAPFVPQSGTDKRRIVLNNFNATGGNTSLLIEDAPPKAAKGEDTRSSHIITVSGRTASAVVGNAERLVSYLDQNPDTKLADLAYTTTARRMHHTYRKAFAATSVSSLQEQLKSIDQDSAASTQCLSSPSSVFMFTGQGSQYLGMGKELYETSATFRDTIDDMCNICRQHDLPTFDGIIRGDQSQTFSPVQVQLAIVCVEIAVAQMWQSWGVKPTAVIGHSLGEYGALCIAGVLSVNDAIYLVGKRAKYMEEKVTADTHAMIAIQAGVDSASEIMSEGQMPSCEIACYNGPTSTVVSGEIDDVKSLQSSTQKAGIRGTILEVPFAFHSSQMDPILEDIKDSFQDVKFSKPQIPIASTLLGEIVTEQGVFNTKYLARQAREPVQFIDALKECVNQGLANDGTQWIEMGPHPLCHGMVRSTLGVSPVNTIASFRRDENTWTTLSKSLASAYNAGLSFSWGEYHRDFKNNVSLLELPTYAFDLKNYWIDYEGGWKLTKGDTTATASSPAASKFYTTCLQKIESETIAHDSASVKFSSQLSEPMLNTAIRGHLVEGVGLCPSSVYADIAFTAASYIYSRVNETETIPAMDLHSMEIFNPLVIKTADTTQTLSVSAEKKNGEDSVVLAISSLDGKVSKDHCRCTITFGEGQKWRDEWNKNAYLIQSRVDQLTNAAREGSIHKILKDLMYKMFCAVVKYSEEYHTCDYIDLDCNLNEATASMNFTLDNTKGEYLYSPFWIDSVVHLAGFVLNGNVKCPEDTVYISHGWETFRISRPLEDGKKYQGYVRMQSTNSKGVLAGDVYLFDGDEITVVCSGVKFQEMKRSTLQILLGVSNGSSAPARKQSIAAPAPTKKKSKKSAPAPVSNPFDDILATIASEVGLDISEFKDTSNVVEMGVDSLLTISILSKLREQTGLDLPTSLFNDNPTVSQLKSFFKDKLPEGDAAVAEESSASDDESSDASDGTMTPASVASSATSASMSRSESASGKGDSNKADLLSSIVAREVGCDTSEITPSTKYSDLGVDSLLTISILHAFKEEAGEELDASFFQDNPTPADVAKAFGITSAPPAERRPSKAPKKEPAPRKNSTAPAKQAEKSSEPTCVTLLLQGDKKSGKTPLFLLPDGAGSLFSYINVPALPQKLPVYGIDSPFHKNPEDYTISFSEVAEIYIKAIRKIQPHGPYQIGGWSLGGIHAYEVTRQLIVAGEKVEHLIMVDSPCPGTLPPLPSPSLDLLEKAGIFDGLGKSGGPVAAHTREHFLKCVYALEHWKHRPLTEDEAKSLNRVTVVWAREGVLEHDDEARKEWSPVGNSEEGLNADMERAKEWLTGKRVSFGPEGWDGLTRKEPQCFNAAGNHFSIMFPPNVSELGEHLAKVL